MVRRDPLAGADTVEVWPLPLLAVALLKEPAGEPQGGSGCGGCPVHKPRKGFAYVQLVGRPIDRWDVEVDIELNQPRWYFMQERFQDGEEFRLRKRSAGVLVRSYSNYDRTVQESTYRSLFCDENLQINTLRGLLKTVQSGK